MQIADKIRAVNPILRGWGQYFRISNAHRHFKKVDSYVYTKLVTFLRRKAGDLSAAEAQAPGQGIPSIPPVFL